MWIFVLKQNRKKHARLFNLNVVQPQKKKYSPFILIQKIFFFRVGRWNFWQSPTAANVFSSIFFLLEPKKVGGIFYSPFMKMWDISLLVQNQKACIFAPQFLSLFTWLSVMLNMFTQPRNFCAYFLLVRASFDCHFSQLVSAITIQLEGVLCTFSSYSFAKATGTVVLLLRIL